MLNLNLFALISIYVLKDLMLSLFACGLEQKSRLRACIKKGRFPLSPLFLLIRAFLGTARQRGLNFFIALNPCTQGENLGISAFAGTFEAVSCTPSARLQRADLSSVVGAGFQE